MDWLLEATRLLDERTHQVLREHLGDAGDVEDVLLGIQRGELSTGVRKRIDDLRRHAAHTRVKKSEESRGPSAYDRYVFDLLTHSLSFAGPRDRYKPRPDTHSL